MPKSNEHHVPQESVLMKSRLLPVLALALLAAPCTLIAQQPATQRPARVRAKLDGFDITPQTGKAANTIGGASRGIGGITLYAPKMAKAYTLTPTFSWNAGDQSEVVFTVTPAATGSEPLYKTTTSANHLTYPADAPALQPGHTYVWTVSPTLDLMGGTGSARFTVVGGDERAAIDAAIGKEKSSNATTAQAKLFISKRLWYDAVQAYSELIANHPDQQDLYRDRAELYDSVPQTHALADLDTQKVQH